MLTVSTLRSILAVAIGSEAGAHIERIYALLPGCHTFDF